MKSNRVKNSIVTFTAGVGGQILMVIMGFVTRSVFVSVLDKEYLGLHGLFSNIISMLSLAELGVGTSIIYNMYKPIAEGDHHKIYLLTKFYKTAYRFIAVIITVVGCVLVPFLPLLIKQVPEGLNIYVIFFLYLLQSITSYLFFAYKNTLITAHQKGYIIHLTGYIFTVGTNILQIISLIVFKNIYIYLFLFIFSTICKNFVLAKISDRMYPFTLKKNKETLPKAEMKEIIKNCYSISIYKLNGIIVDATDNIVLSSFVGLTLVGLYSNYILITSSLKQIINLVFTSANASLGNLHASEDVSADKKVNIFFVLNFLSVFLNGVAGIGVFITGNTFLSIWLGKDFLLPQSVCLALALNFYFQGLQTVTGISRNAMGLFAQMKYRPLIGAVLNVAISIALVFPLGVTGVVLGTVISGALTYSWFDPLIVFKVGFGRSVAPYYKKNLSYLFVMLVSAAIAYLLVRALPFTGIILFLAGGMISVIVPSVALWLFFRKTNEFIYLKRVFFSIIKRQKPSFK